MLYGVNIDDLTERLYALKGKAILEVVDMIKKIRAESDQSVQKSLYVNENVEGKTLCPCASSMSYLNNFLSVI
jgi:GTP cyclohydrolase FolE2